MTTVLNFRPLPKLEYEAPEAILARLDQEREEALTRNPDALWIGLLPRQELMSDVAQVADETFTGGAKSPGKTEWLRAEAIKFALEFPGSRTGIFRASYGELRETLIDRLLRTPNIEKYGKFSWETLTFTWKNDSVTIFQHCDNLADATKHAGKQYNLLIIDELTHLDYETFLTLKTCNRTAVAHIPTRLICASNPLEQGHGWVKEYFVDSAPLGGIFEVDDRTTLANGRVIQQRKTRAFVPARVEDNAYIVVYDPGYIATLNALPEPKRSAYLFGVWTYVEGAFFSDWSLDRHVVEPFNPSAHWAKFRVVDWGFEDPFGTLWFAIDPDTGRLFVYREVFQQHLGHDESKLLVTQLSAADERIVYTIADTSGLRKEGTKKVSAFDIWQAEPNAIRLSLPNKTREPGWLQLKSLLKTNLPDGKPGLQVTANCTALIKQFGQAITSKFNNEDLQEPKGRYDPTSTSQFRDDLLDCLIASTRVLTNHGLRAIALVEAGDWVMTRGGWRRVERAWKVSDAAECLEVRCSNGTILTGTPDHRVWTQNRGWLPLNALRYGDTLLSWEEQKLSSSTASRSDATPTPRDQSGGGTTLLAAITARSAWATSIKRFGRRITGRFQQAIRSITATATRSITTSPTSSASPLERIAPVTRKCSLATSASGYETMQRVSAHSLRSGTALTRGEPGTVSIRVNSNNTGMTSLSNEPASGAGSRTPPRTAEKAVSAPMPASQHGDEKLVSTTNSAPVPSAGQPSPQTDTTRLGAVRAVVHGVYALANKHAVYDLTVDDDTFREFFAEGVLVHNCARYGVMSQLAILKKRDRPKRERLARPWQSLKKAG